MKNQLALAAATFAVAALAALPSALAADAVKTITDRTLACEASVPASWTPAGGPGSISVKSPKGDASIILSGTPGTLAEAKKITVDMGIFEASKVYEDSTRRYWIEFTPRNEAPGQHQYALVAQAGTVCGMQLDWTGGLTDTQAKAIVNSLKKR